ncbi:acyltransferase family protein [Microbacterium limosum]|uniref:Acyltransferase family protein n=1 Tax=Microbacterium limosum TaxID=3079935 RepID=A0AAU0MGG6_9MICO|nr:acyltransferase family protein [Microbacterium sp. Y20]WOQ69285.1 acyltransferase family protein [Microbacterium sp. Y20]
MSISPALLDAPPSASASPADGAAAAPSAVPRYAGLDGLRAVAVALVVAYHLFPGLGVRQGFIGVDVFFVISGFLITSLLLRETSRTGRIRLGEFWRRRARRLIPAIVVLILVCATWAWLQGGDALVGLGRQVLGALTFSYNWLSIQAGTGYFQEGTPELFRNLWSLAVEEQFYVVWPLVLPAVLLLRAQWARGAIAVLAAGASAGWMAALVAGGADPTRAYFGTDTHGFGILLGVALAFVAERALSAPRPWMSHAAVRIGMSGFAALALAALLLLATLQPTLGTATFPGALAAASLLSAAAIAGAVWPGSLFGRAIDASPLRWVGERSFGIYLWHWPLLVLLLPAAAADAEGVPAWIGGTALALTLAASWASYRWVEQPVRRLGYRGCLRRLRARLGGAPLTRLSAVLTILVICAGIAATTAGIAAAPARSSGEAAVFAGQAALRQGGSVGDRVPGTSTQPRPPLAPTPAGSPTAAPQPVAIAGDQVTAVGDSVMLASAGGLMDRLPGIQVDAAVSRSMHAAPGILESLSGSGQLRPFVVLALGTNGPVDDAALSRAADIAGPDRTLVLVNAYAPRDWIPGVNSDLEAFAATRENVVIADWSATAAAHTDLLAGDRIHPGQAGGRLFAETVASAVQGAEDARAQREFERAQLRSALATRLVVGDE